ncbi:MAG TPA: YMGG-like glycine zipper-containing protein [Flavobacterium sp.]|nr:YMGG-like glycine zipper-containing protein [Flavobacterium sp.]
MKKAFLILAIAVLSFSCKDTAKEKAELEAAKQATIDSIQNVEMQKQQAELAKQKSIDSMKTVMAQQRAAQNATAANDATPAQKKKKGWSNTAKGAAIGAGVGLVTGAIVDKKHPGKGALIGGAIGAGGGAVTGAIIDNEKKKKEEAAVQK